MEAHYRIGLEGTRKYLRVHTDGSREWVDDINDATTWPTIGECRVVMDTIKPVPLKRIKWGKDGKPSKVVTT